ncbi:S41 family peptidase [Candidatus Desulforudis audaxviator]|uniref:Carboxyl-terminal protease n=1 Tax=Desulforudis audaxviator (strain MP104C) TaxID=477974 RepID=B1I134_DESAP|nr:S41 family peptidase [Candidatus Desulforudis audaxviator]ACA58848.1 carboxyl-terminal protease [Candidatus Desulforudis audaxviator MP104C]
MPRRQSMRWFFYGMGSLLVGAVIVLNFAVFTNFKQLGNLVQVVRLVHAEYLEAMDSERMIEGAIRGVVEALDDPYSVYLEPETYARFMEQVKGSFGGIGILVGYRDEGLTVVRPYEGTPAAEAGLRAGDVILAVDGKDTRDMDLETAVMLMRGEVGTQVRLTIRRDSSGEPLEFMVVRRQIQVPTVEGELKDGGIGYVVISQFTEKTGGELAYLLNSFESGLRGLILDLRDNPGGDLMAAVEVADLFLGTGPIVHIDYRTGEDETYYAEKHRLEVPLVVLINRTTASAAEIVAGAVKDTKSGILIGTQTYGKGVVQNVFPLRNGAGLKLTTARYLTPLGYDLNRKGIKPHIEVEDSADFESDPQLEKALEILKAGLK